MRFFGFFTGVALLAGLFFYFQEPILNFRKIEPIPSASVDVEDTLNSESVIPIEIEIEMEKIQPVEAIPEQQNNESVSINDKLDSKDEMTNDTSLDDLSVKVEEGLAADQSTADQISRSERIENSEINPGQINEITQSNLDIPENQLEIHSDGINGIEEPLRPPQQVQWATFWRPFNSRGSAQGFADNLAKRTDLEIKVTKNTLGAFVVSYPYTSEEERQLIAQKIREKTGLSLIHR